MNMNDFVLRGFCKKCDESHRFREDNEYGLCDEGYSCQPVWFLSPTQMKILEVSKEIWNYEGFADMLERNPFLVAKILKEAGKHE